MIRACYTQAKRHASKIVYLIMAVAGMLGIAGGLLSAMGGSQAATVSTVSHTASPVARHYSTVAAVTHSAPAAQSMTVKLGQTLSGIARHRGLSLAQIEADNPQLSGNFNLITVGETVYLVPGLAPAAPVSNTPLQQPQQLPVSTPASSTPLSQASQTPAPAQQPLQQAPVQQSAPEQSPAPVQQQAAQQPQSSGGSGVIGDIPGMPAGLAQCIAYRESSSSAGSTTVGNPAAGGNAYGIIPASGYNVAGDSIAQQSAVASHLYQEYGGAPWAADGCPGT